MKRWLVLIFITALLASLSFWGAQVAPGYVLFDWLGYTAEMTVWVLLISLLLVAFGLWLSYRVIYALLFVPLRAGSWLFRSDDAQLQSMTAHALAAFEEGHWLRAKKLLLRVAKHSQNPLVFYLMAARASHALGESEEVASYLKSATNAAPAASMAINLTQAQLQLADGALESCLATLVRAHAMDEDHPEVMRMLAKVYFGLNDWQKLNRLLPKIKRLHVLNEAEIRQYVQASAQAGLQQAANEGLLALQTAWKDLPSTTRQDPAIVLIYVRLLEGMPDVQHDVFETLKTAIKHNPEHSGLLLYFCELEHASPELGLQFLQKLSVNTAAYYLAMAGLAKRSGLQGQAAVYLDQANATVAEGDSDIRLRIQLGVLAQAIEAKQPSKALSVLESINTAL